MNCGGPRAPRGTRDLTGPFGFPRAAGDPAAYVTADGIQHVIYRDGDGNLHELWWTTGAPEHRDLTGPFGFPLPRSDPAAYVTADGTQHVIYRGRQSRRWPRP